LEKKLLLDEKSIRKEEDGINRKIGQTALRHKGEGRSGENGKRIDSPSGLGLHLLFTLYHLFELTISVLKKGRAGEGSDLPS
jgi:hypothetical protein